MTFARSRRDARETRGTTVFEDNRANSDTRESSRTDASFEEDLRNRRPPIGPLVQWIAKLSQHSPFPLLFMPMLGVSYGSSRDDGGISSIERRGGRKRKEEK